LAASPVSFTLSVKDVGSPIQAGKRRQALEKLRSAFGNSGAAVGVQPRYSLYIIVLSVVEDGRRMNYADPITGQLPRRRAHSA